MKREINLQDFKSIERMGSGASGSVDKVSYLNEVYALKKIRYVSDSSSDQLLTRELDALISCDSQYIVQCYGAFYSQGYGFWAMG